MPEQGARGGDTMATNHTRRTAALMIATALAMASFGSIAFVQNVAPGEETAYVCPMHPDYTMDVAGKCPRCGMALVHAAPFDVRDYELEFTTLPPVVKPGEKATLRFRIFH